ncbi:hypothetical protein GOP47_0012744 [Adiantum capillus-veneris]|uniref:Uncharacterized protein n=1 Tax=Adiantum capillus-veneris TaxID=13818 RepID=A0A9D4ZEL2_ADICA|nr:hypothetical protein GOP47_0012744 [Adiantum capillus-veneris]
MAANSFCSSLSMLGTFLLLCVFCSLSCASRIKAFDVSAKCPSLFTNASLTSGETRSNSSTLLVVPWRLSFKQFVKFRPDSCLLDGFSVQVLLQALRYMERPPQYKFVLHGSGDAEPNYDDMIDMLVNKTWPSSVLRSKPKRLRRKRVVPL